MVSKASKKICYSKRCISHLTRSISHFRSKGGKLLARTIPSSWIPTELSFVSGSPLENFSNIKLLDKNINYIYLSIWQTPNHSITFLVRVYWHTPPKLYRKQVHTHTHRHTHIYSSTKKKRKKAEVKTSFNEEDFADSRLSTCKNTPEADQIKSLT